MKTKFFQWILTCGRDCSRSAERANSLCSRSFTALAAILICGSSVFTSCSSNEDNSVVPVEPDLNIAKNIIGKWMYAERNGQPMVTNRKTVYTFVSPTKAYMSASLNTIQELGPQWNDKVEVDVAINGNKMTLISHPDEHMTVVDESIVTNLGNSEFTCDSKVTFTVDGVFVRSGEYRIRYEKVTVDYSEAVLGTWEGRCTSEGSVFDDGQEHRWEFKADGTYVYYVRDGENWVPYDENALNEYFVDGNLLCFRWVDNGVENREWWEITIADGKMFWTALRQNEDGTTFTATFEMTKVAE